MSHRETDATVGAVVMIVVAVAILLLSYGPRVRFYESFMGGYGIDFSTETQQRSIHLVIDPDYSYQRLTISNYARQTKEEVDAIHAEAEAQSRRGNYDGLGSIYPPLNEHRQTVIEAVALVYQPVTDFWEVVAPSRQPGN